MLRSLAAIAASVALGPLAPSAVDLSWHPAEKAKVAKTFAINTELHAPSVRWTIGGQVYMTDPCALILEMNERYAFLDVIQRLGSGRPAALARTFDKIEARHTATYASAPLNRPNAYESDLALETVLFTWNEDEHAWNRTFARDKKSNTSILDALEENIDFRAFVPEKPVARGASWDIDATAFDLLFAPGGDLRLHLELGADEDRDTGRQIDLFLAKHLKGWSQGTFRRVYDDHGVECAEIQVEAHLTSEGTDEPENGIKVKGSAEISVKGELLWDLAAHRPHSADLRTELTGHFLLEWTWGKDPRSWSAEIGKELDLDGTTKLLATFEAR